jgi:hypothetical protein
MKMVLLFCFICLTFLQAQAQVLVVSDIDDTIKLSRTRDFWARIPLAAQQSTAFAEMPRIYQFLQAQTGAEFAYLSSAPSWLMGASHREFLNRNQFPAGEMILRSEFSKSEHKIANLRKILAQKNPKTVVLIGDNGELDISIYDQITREFPQVHFLTYIHRLYASGEHNDIISVRPGQIPFQTPAEILDSWSQKGLVSSEAAHSLSLAIFRRSLRLNKPRSSREVEQPLSSDQEPWQELAVFEKSLFAIRCESVFLSAPASGGF